MHAALMTHFGRVLRRAAARVGRSRLPQFDGRIYLPILRDIVSVRRDQWGIPYIHARNRHDLFMAQGFVHAQDRLWQMELNRRAANGQLSAVFGPVTLSTDRLARTLGFARLARQDWATLGQKEQADLLAYANGVNAYLQTTRTLPLEFSLIRHKLQPWHVLDSLAYSRLQVWALTHGAMGELIRAQLIEQIGPELAGELTMNYPPANPVTLSRGIEFNRWSPDGMLRAAVGPFLGKGTLDGAGRGSNGWVISAQRSQTGHALLCNDTHLPLRNPAHWYFMHCRSDDGLAVAGFTQAGLPYVLVGYNQDIAWGATLSYTDCEDLFVERFQRPDPGRYLFRDTWLEATVHEERIAVRNRPDHVEKVIQTHHGPVISKILPQNGQTLALSSIALTGCCTFDGFARLNEARNWDDFVHAMRRIESPSLNVLYADRQDNIGYWVCGRVPVRSQGDGLLPAPGWSGNHEWNGYIPFDEMPHALNPEEGFIISANHRIVDDGYPYYLGQVWRNGFRAHRLKQLITSKDRISLSDCRRMQTDVYCEPGVQLVEHLQSLEPADDDARLSLTLLRQWNGRLEPDSIGGAVYQVFLTALAEGLLAPHFDTPARSRYLGLGLHPILAPINEYQGYWTVTLLRWLDQPQTLWLPSDSDRRRSLERCLSHTTAEMRRLLGPDPSQWHWGRLHQVRFAHNMSVQPPLDRIFDIGPFPIGGDSDTVAQTGFRPDQPYENNAISVASRLIVDMGNLDQVQGVLPPGQSGHLASSHYDDQVNPWLSGSLISVPWHGAAIIAQSRHHCRLQPVSGY